MHLYLIRRLLLIVPILIGLSLITFGVSRLVPGDPVGLAAGPQATDEIRERLREEFGLDQPLPVQYLTYVSGLLQGDFGQSLYTRREVADDLQRYIPATLELTLAAVAIASAIGIPLGIISALYRNRFPDHSARVVSLFFVSFPAFWLAMIFQSFLGLNLGAAPISGRFPRLDAPPEPITGLYLIDSLVTLNFEALGSTVYHLWLPALVLSFGALASITRITRASMLEALTNDSVRMERAIGIPWRVIVMKYVLRNAFVATLTIISLEFGWLMAGAVLVESIFDWPGLGLYIVESSLRLDFQPIMGVTIVYGMIFSLVNIITDMAYGIIDPRIRYG
ncbi:MAG: ABC transporter permease [Chloroflexi bacterium]|nr:ABC transporter permease [Chloroflexota bacterium]